MAEKPVSVARLRGPRGVRGQMWVEPYREGLEALAAGEALWAAPPGGSLQTFTLREFFVYDKGAVLQLEQVGSVERARAMEGWEVFLPAERVAPDSPDAFYTDEVEGFVVEDRRRGGIGTVTSVSEGPAYWIFHARGPRGELEIPAVKGLRVEVRKESRRILVDLPDGYPGLEGESDAH